MQKVLEYLETYKAKIQEAVGKFYTFDSRILNLKNKINNADSEKLNSYNERLENIKKEISIIKPSVEEFVKFVGNMTDNAGTIQISTQYIVENTTDFLTATTMCLNFIFIVQEKIKNIDNEINTFNSVLDGETSFFMASVKEYAKKPSVWIIGLGGLWLIRKILR